jgi:hypothetical protein
MHNIQKSTFRCIGLFIALCTPLAYAHAASLTISSASPGDTVSVNTTVTFSVTPTGFNAPTYTISDDQGAYLTPYLNAFGNFLWTPVEHDVATHVLTISATDSGGNSASVSKTITVIKPSATLSNIVGGPTAYVGTPMTFHQSFLLVG